MFRCAAKIIARVEKKVPLELLFHAYKVGVGCSPPACQMFADWQAADRQLYLPAVELTSAGPPGPPAGDRRQLTRTSQLLQLLVGPNQLPSKLGILKY